MASIDDLIAQSQPKITDGYSPSNVPCYFVTGPAGTGKTRQQKEEIKKDPKYGLLCATTGIAAINLGATTLNTALKYFDTDSLRDKFVKGRLRFDLHQIGKRIKRLVIDEVSMMDGDQLDYIHQAMIAVNGFADMNDAPMGIVLTGDFCQLPPVKAKWAFEAACWEDFERNTTRLTKIWRQDDAKFVEALNAARGGNGKLCVEILREIGAHFADDTVQQFDGTTIMSKNDQVDAFNFASLLKLPGEAFGLKSVVWGNTNGEWKNIPDMLKLKDKALVMILSNDTEGFTYANGDMGHILGRNDDGGIVIELKRNGAYVTINPIIRYKVSRGKEMERDLEKLGTTTPPDRLPHVYCGKHCDDWEPELGAPTTHAPWGQPVYNCHQDVVYTGAIKYYPLRLAYATTVHKSQGLTLDACQIDCRDAFFGSPQMAYVALSRCRTAGGLTIVGSPKALEQRIKLESKIKRWL